MYLGDRHPIGHIKTSPKQGRFVHYPNDCVLCHMVFYVTMVTFVMILLYIYRSLQILSF